METLSWSWLELERKVDNKRVAGAPQHHLTQVPNGNKELLTYVLGDEPSSEAKADLDGLVHDKIAAGQSSQPVYLCYSDRVHTFQEHVSLLLTDLERANRKVVADVHHFDDHGVIGKYFSSFLLATMEELVG